MRIADTYNKLTAEQAQVALARKAADAKNPPAADAGKGAEPQGAVKVTVSAEARALAEAHEAGGIDQAKVDRLRAAVQQGSLKVDTAKIAARIADGD